MSSCEEKLKEYISHHKINAEHLFFSQSCHSVADAARAAQATPDSFVKNICLIDTAGQLVVAILKGEDRLDVKKLQQETGLTLRMAKAPEVLEKTQYPIGGVPSFGYEALFFIDIRVLQKEIVYSGGGSDQSLVRISSKELARANKGYIVDIAM